MAISDRELHRVVSTVIVYNKEGKFLLAKRSQNMDVYPGMWGTPGGGLSMDDYDHLPSSTPNHKQWYFVIEKSLRREVKEELNVEIGPPEYLLDVAFVRPDGVPVIVLVYYAEFKSGEVKLSPEDDEFAWVTYEEAKSYDLIEGVLGEIEMVHKRLKK